MLDEPGPCVLPCAWPPSRSHATETTDVRNPFEEDADIKASQYNIMDDEDVWNAVYAGACMLPLHACGRHTRKRST